MGDYHLEIEGVKGESPIHGGSFAMDVESWSYGLTSPSDPYSKSGVGAVQVSDIQLTKAIDIASPALISACIGNRNFTRMKLLCRKGGGDQFVFYTVELENARISSITAMGAESPGQMPFETITISFKKAKWEYQAQMDGGRMGGKTSAQYNVARNEL
jgi:type VI secretion system secreted protein Hcp